MQFLSLRGDFPTVPSPGTATSSLCQEDVAGSGGRPLKVVMWLLPVWSSVGVAAGLLLCQLTIWDSFFLIGTHSDAHVPQMSQCHRLLSKVTPSCWCAIY